MRAVHRSSNRATACAYRPFVSYRLLRPAQSVHIALRAVVGLHHATPGHFVCSCADGNEDSKDQLRRGHRIPIRREFSVPLERGGRGARSPHDPRGPALHERDIYGTDLGRLRQAAGLAQREKLLGSVQPRLIENGSGWHAPRFTGRWPVVSDSRVEASDARVGCYGTASPKKRN